MMSELKALVDMLNAHLSKKEMELSSQENYDSYTKSEIENREKDINAFAVAAESATTDPTLKQDVIINFTKGAYSIISDIDKIKNGTIISH